MTAVPSSRPYNWSSGSPWFVSCLARTQISQCVGNSRGQLSVEHGAICCFITACQNTRSWWWPNRRGGGCGLVFTAAEHALRADNGVERHNAAVSSSLGILFTPHSSAVCLFFSFSFVELHFHSLHFPGHILSLSGNIHVFQCKMRKTSRSLCLPRCGSRFLKAPVVPSSAFWFHEVARLGQWSRERVLPLYSLLLYFPVL